MNETTPEIFIKQTGADGKPEEVGASLDDLMQLPMDGVQPVYGFENLEAGTFEFRFKAFEPKVVAVSVDKKNPNADKIPRPVIACELEVIGVRKTLNATTNHEELLGKQHNENFFITELERGMGGVQALLLGMGLSGRGTIRELLEQAINHDFVGNIKTRKDKFDPSVEYSNLDLKTVAPIGPPAASATSLNVGVATEQAPHAALQEETEKAAAVPATTTKLSLGG